MPVFRACVVGLALLLTAAAQTRYDRAARAREYVQFLVVQLQQWTEEFPQQFYTALMRSPVGSGKLSEAGKASAGELGDSIKRLAALADAKDVLTNSEFRSRLSETLFAAKEVNQVMGAQRFSTLLRGDWEQIRFTLNNLARIYKLETLAVIDPPDAGKGGRGGRAQAATAPAPGQGGVSGYIVDLSCAKRGKGMWTNVECIARCVRDGDKIVLVTDDGKIYQIANQEKITPESFGQIVTLTGKTEGDTITIAGIRM